MSGPQERRPEAPLTIATHRAGGSSPAAAGFSALLCTLLAACGGSSSAGSSGHGTVTGRVLSAPSCPVERVGSPCPPRPVDGARVVASEGARQVVATQSGAGGAFRLSLPEGTYLVTATNAGGYRSTASSSVDVRRGATVTLTLTVDSGIR